VLEYDPDCDAYVILGLDTGASQKDVEAAYRRAALTWHPDKSPAPDAADRFHEVQHAGDILRDAERRRLYDLLRQKHLGRRMPPPPRGRHKPPEPYVPMRPPPAWLSSKVRVHLDAVMITMEKPRSPAPVSRLCNALALVAVGGAIATSEMMLGLLAVVLWAIGRVFGIPPHEGQLCWAKIVPGRRLAEYHALDQRHHRYERLTVPFHHLRIALIETASGSYRIEIHGFPHKAVPILLHTGDVEEARRCAREAGDWLQLPLARAA